MSLLSRNGWRSARLLLRHKNWETNQRLLLMQTANLSSTFDSMYQKLISHPAVHYMEDTIAQFHDYTGIPWYGTIILCTVGLRTIISLPAQVTSHKVEAKRALLNKEMSENLMPALTKAIDKHIPAWLMISISIRNLSLLRHTPARQEAVPVVERYLQLGTEGAMWFPNMTVPDTSLILPVLVGLSFAMNIFMNSNRSKNLAQTLATDQAVQQGPSDAKTAVVKAPPKFNLKKFRNGVTYFLYGFSCFMVVLAAYQPSALALYWATSGFTGVVLNLVLMSPKFRSLVRIPQVPGQTSTPYVDLKNNVVNVFRQNKLVEMLSRIGK